MPILANPHDTEAAANERAQQADPLVMYLVAPRRPETSSGEQLEAAIAAVLDAERAFAQHPQHGEAYRKWRRRSYRKVCLRGRPSDYERLHELDHVQAGDVLCLPPMLRSQAPREVKRLQAHKGPALAPGEAAPQLAEEEQAFLHLIPAGLGMTLGKAIAQVGHSAHLARELHGCDAGADRVALTSQEVIDRLAAEADLAAVTDAGLTQLERGSRTVYALAPGKRPAWLAPQLHRPA
mgnify:CR=1 FL=1